MKKTFLSLVSLSVLANTPSYAKANYDDRYYISPAISYLRLDEDRNSSRHGKGLSIGLGKAITQNINLEIKTFYQKYENRQKATSDQNAWRNIGISGDVQYYFTRKSLAPYFVAGFGLMNSKTNREKSIGMIAEAGFGLKKDINDNFAVRADLRYRYNNNFDQELAATNSSNRYDDMVLTFGIVIPIGESVADSSKVKPILLDSDKDGVEDNSDKCPNTKHGKRVDFYGCELALQDEILDQDKDGVEDALDKCPNSVLNAKVNADGCEIGLKLEGVNFYGGSSQLTDEAKVILDGVAISLLNNQKNLKAIEVQGHSSGDGDERFNRYLSKKRARSVALYLTDKGVKNRFIVKGYGSSQRIASDETIEGRVKNRRVELHWKR